MSCGLPRDPASSGFAGDGSSGCPESRILSALPAVKLRVSPKPHCARCASRCIPGCPVLLHLPALPAMDFRVAPNLASFSASGASASGFPAASLFRVRLSMQVPRVAPVPASSGCAGNGYSSYPESLVLQRLRCLSPRFPSNSALRLRLPMMLRVAPRASSSGLALGLSFRVAPNSLSFGVRLMDSRVASVFAPSGSAVPASSGFPESCICGWVDDESRFSSNFASSAKLRMNLRIQSGFAHFCPTLDAFSQSHSGSTCRRADL